MMVTKKDLNGDIEGFPLEVVKKMCEEQVRQGNKFDVSIFQEDSTSSKDMGGFNWKESTAFNWSEIIEFHNFEFFYEAISKQSEVGVKVINKSGFDLPKYETKGSAGVDVRSTERFQMMPGQRQLYRTGLFLEIPMGHEAQVRPRSGLAIKSGITVLNAPGTLDSDFTGEVGVILINLSDVPFVVEKGDRIAQLIFARVAQAKWIEVEELTETERGQEGFGSTGVK